MQKDPHNPQTKVLFPEGYRPRPHEIVPIPDWVVNWRDGPDPIPDEWRHLFPDEPESAPRRRGWRGFVDWFLCRT